MKCLEIFNRGRSKFNHYLDLYGNELQNYFVRKVTKEDFIDVEEELSLIKNDKVGI